MEKVFFTQGGSDSIDTAMRLVRQYWKVRGKIDKIKFIALSKGYHGTHYGGASLSGDPRFRRNYEPGVPGIFHIPTPCTYRNPFDEDNPENLSKKCIQSLEALIASQGSDTIAAFVMEPIIGSGGVIVPHENFMKEVRNVCDRNDILLIADEVICAFGRTGEWTGSRLWGVKPDVMTIAKALTGGYFPMGATLMSGEISEAIEKNDNTLGLLGHGYTNSGNPVGAAAALAALEETNKLNLASNAKARGAELILGLNKLKNKHEIIGDVRGKGLMAAVEMVEDPISKKPAGKDIVAKIFQAICDEGVLLRASGNNFILSPSLIINKDHVNKIITAMDKGFSIF
jgi:adenosylmethionine-8-amino-7-oxononanoate aminotransferase